MRSIISKLYVVKNLVMALVVQPIMRLILSLFPLQHNKFFCISMNGNNYGDNIKVLSDYIANVNPSCVIIWGFNSKANKSVNCPHKKCELFTFLYYYHILTSKFILSNFAMDLQYLQKRKGQLYLETWHGTALKQIGYNMYKNEKQDILYRWFKIDRIKHTVDITDFLLSGSRYMTDIFRKSFLYKKEIFEVGTPRNDIFFTERNDLRDKINKIYGINNQKKILLYAPTFRQDGKLTYYNVDLERITIKLKEQFGYDYAILLRLHPSIMGQEDAFSKLFPYETVNVTSYPDMQELLYVTDVLVTDYSSSMFDFMYLRRPIVLYVPDKNTYSRGFYFDIEKIPAAIIYNNDELDKVLESYNWNDLEGSINAFLEELGDCESGHATEFAYNLLLKN